MSVRVKLISGHDVLAVILSGAVTTENIIESFARVPASDKRLHLVYLAPGADLSGVTVADAPKLKRFIAAKLHELYGDQRVPTAWVCEAGADEQFAEIWRHYVEAGGDYPSQPVMFHTLQAACDWLGLPEAGRQAAIEAIET